MSTIRTFEDLDCWKASRDFRMFVSGLVKEFPKEETYQLVSQMRNASRSITHNIAEGYGRFHYLDNAKFVSNSRGSLFEVMDQLITANDEGYITTEDLEKGRELFENALRPLNGYIKYLQTAGANSSTANEPIEEYGLTEPASEPSEPTPYNQ